MPGPFCIWIVSPLGNIHSRCFEEVALGLRAAFAALGFNAPIVTDPAKIEGHAIVLGANMLTYIDPALSARLIIYNLEQIEKSSPWLKQEYVEMLRRYPVWDYSERNIAELKSYGMHNVTLCGIGYMPELTRIPNVVEDIDVVFIGSITPKRKIILEHIAARGNNVVTGFGTYGKTRDMLFARAKLVLNLHSYEARVFEIVRVSYLLANRRCVVSETGHDQALETPVKEGVAFAPYESLVDTCLRLLADNGERAQIAQKGFECFSALSQVPMLKRALDSLPQ